MAAGAVTGNAGLYAAGTEALRGGGAMVKGGGAAVQGGRATKALVKGKKHKNKANPNL